ncbi:MAG: stage II sporulation protein M [Neisseriaceae bacterium]|nr:stage II sporulation protein M [Neisseriaceae bacterium]
MKQFEFEQRYESFWQDFSAEIDAAEKNRTIDNARHFTQRYRQLCRQTMQAENRAYSPSLVEELNRLTARAHQVLYRYQAPVLPKFLQWLKSDLPRQVRAEKTVVIWSHILFYVPFIVFFVLCAIFPHWANDLPGVDMVEMQEMYQDRANRMMNNENRPLDTSFMMFGHYILNNISIGFQSVGGGFLFGLGTIYILVLNGYMMGAIEGAMLHSDPAVATAFYSFVEAGHGGFEFTGIVLAGAAGLRIGLALLAPQGYSRLDALKIQGKKAGQLIIAAFFFLFIAAIFEAFWSSNTLLPPYFKIGVGFALWIAVYVYLLFGGRQK